MSSEASKQPNSRWACDICGSTFFTYGAASVCEETCAKHAKQRARATAEAVMNGTMPAAAAAPLQSRRSALVERVADDQRRDAPAPAHDPSVPLNVEPARPTAPATNLRVETAWTPGETMPTPPLTTDLIRSGRGPVLPSEEVAELRAAIASSHAETLRTSEVAMAALKEGVVASITAQLTENFEKKHAETALKHAEALRVHEESLRQELARRVIGGRSEETGQGFESKLREELLDAERRATRAQEKLDERDSQLAQARGIAEREREARQRERAAQLEQLRRLGAEAAMEKAEVLEEHTTALRTEARNLSTEAVASSEARAIDAEHRAEELRRQCNELSTRLQAVTSERDEYARQCTMVTAQLDLFESALGDRLEASER